MASDKKILFSVIIIGFLMLAFGIWAIFYWQKTHIALDISPEAVKAKCLENLSKMTSEQIIEKINQLSFATDEEIRQVKREMKNYLVCRLNSEMKEFDKQINPELYRRTANLIQRLKIPKEQIDGILGEDALGRMLYLYDEEGKKIRSIRRNTYPSEVALMPIEVTHPSEVALIPIEVICPAGEEATDFLETCLNSGVLRPENINRLTAIEVEEAKNRCNNLCNNLIRYIKAPSIFEKEMANFEWYSLPDFLRPQFLGRAAAAFRLGGKELAFKLCDSIPNPYPTAKDECRRYVEGLDYINCKDFGFSSQKCQERKYSECMDYYNHIKELICELEVRKYSQ